MERQEESSESQECPAPSRLRAGAELARGTRLCDDRYEVLDRIARGATSTVYRARQRRMGRQVALKVYSEAFLDQPAALAAIESEATAAAGLTHPNLLQLLDRDQDGDLHFLVMELLRGQTLAERLRNGQGLSSHAVVAIAADVLSALTVMHDAGVIHRDLTPDNVVLVPRMLDEGQLPVMAKVCDFGSARSVQDGSPHPSAMESLDAYAEYRSPELLLGAAVDGRSDLYSVAVMLAHMLTGALPSAVREDDAEPASRSLVVRGGGVPGIADEVAEIIRRARATSCSERYATAREMRKALLQARHDASQSGSALATLPSARPQAMTQPAPASASLARAAPAESTALLLVPPRKPAGSNLPVVRHKQRPGSWAKGRTARVRRAEDSSQFMIALTGLLCVCALIWSSTGGLGRPGRSLCEEVDCDGVVEWSRNAAEKGANVAADLAERGSTVASRLARRWFDSLREALHEELQP